MTQTDLTRVEIPKAPQIGTSAASEADEKCRALELLIQATGHRGLDRVTVATSDGCIVLGGRVSTYYLKQLAQEAVRPMAIGMQICNEIRVEN